MKIQLILHDRKMQSGRSMSEMLGVLAVVGVLSIAAISGFSFMMEVHKENVTLDRLSKVIAGVQTTNLLSNETVSKNGNGFVSKSVNMNNIISDIGGDMASDGSYITTPLKNENGDQVKISVKLVAPASFSIQTNNLSRRACKKIVQSNLGYSYVYDGSKWISYEELLNDDTAEAYCAKIVSQDKQTAFSNLFVKSAFAQPE